MNYFWVNPSISGLIKATTMDPPREYELFISDGNPWTDNIKLLCDTHYSQRYYDNLALSRHWPGTSVRNSVNTFAHEALPWLASFHWKRCKNIILYSLVDRYFLTLSAMVCYFQQPILFSTSLQTQGENFYTLVYWGFCQQLSFYLFTLKTFYSKATTSRSC